MNLGVGSLTRPFLTPNASRKGIPTIGPIAAPVFHAVIGQTMLSRFRLLVSMLNCPAIVAPGVATTVELRPTSMITKQTARNIRHFWSAGQLNGFSGYVSQVGCCCCCCSLGVEIPVKLGSILGPAPLSAFKFVTGMLSRFERD